MNQFDITKALAAEQHHDRTRAASESWLAALVRCCRPTAWGRAARRLTNAALDVKSRQRAASVACCA